MSSDLKIYSRVTANTFIIEIFYLVTFFMLEKTLITNFGKLAIIIFIYISSLFLKKSCTI